MAEKHSPEIDRAVPSEDSQASSELTALASADTDPPETQIHEIDETPSAGSSAAGDALGSLRSREIPVSTLVRLLGLPTKSELSLVEAKIDTLTLKMATLSSKIDRLSTQVPQLFSDFDRTNVQIADLREFMRKMLAAVVAQLNTPLKVEPTTLTDAEAKRSAPEQGSSNDSSKHKVNILSSE